MEGNLQCATHCVCGMMLKTKTVKTQINYTNSFIVSERVKSLYFGVWMVQCPTQPVCQGAVHLLGALGYSYYYKTLMSVPSEVWWEEAEANSPTLYTQCQFEAMMQIWLSKPHCHICVLFLPWPVFCHFVVRSREKTKAG